MAKNTSDTALNANKPINLKLSLILIMILDDGNGYR